MNRWDNTYNLEAAEVHNHEKNDRILWLELRKMRCISCNDQRWPEDFIKKHADANNAIEKWVEKIEAANWKNHNELKKDFLSADYVGNNRYVFNIRGNNYRLVSVVVFFAGTMVIRFIGTHNDYDRIDAKNI